MLTREDINRFFLACHDKKQYQVDGAMEKHFKCLPNCVSIIRFHSERSKEGKRWLKSEER